MAPVDNEGRERLVHLAIENDLTEATLRTTNLMSTTAHKLFFALRCVFSAALIAFVLRKVNWTALFEIVHRIDAKWAAIASVLTGLQVMGLAVRWRLFLSGKDIDLPFRTILALTWAGQFFNALLPGSTGGDFVKIYQACRLSPDRKAAAAATVLADRLTGLLGLLLLGGLGLALNPLPLRVFSNESVALGKTIALLSIGFVLLLVTGWLLFCVARNTLWGGRLLRTLAAAKGSFSFDWRWFTVFFISLAMHFLTTLTAYLFAKALGTNLSYVQVLLMVPVVSLLIMLPITINGHGLRELLLIAYFSEMGPAITGSFAPAIRETAVAFSLLMVTNDLLWASPGGIVYVLRFKNDSRSRPMKLKPGH